MKKRTKSTSDAGPRQFIARRYREIDDDAGGTSAIVDGDVITAGANGRSRKVTSFVLFLLSPELCRKTAAKARARSKAKKGQR